MDSRKSNEGMRSITLAALAAAVTIAAAFVPTTAGALPSLPMCSSLASTLQTENTDILAATSSVQPAGGGNVSYCLVMITVSDLSGPAGGYLPGQKQHIGIAIGLPLNPMDGGGSQAVGNWNGRIMNIGGGVYQGVIDSVTPATNANFAGSNTDTGHTGNPALGGPIFGPLGDGTWALNPDDTLNTGLVDDFAFRGIHEQTAWTKKLVKTYYGQNPAFTYWNGCSTGGRQGHEQAEKYPDDYDGILSGAPAFNWDRFFPGEFWSAVVMNQEVGAPIVAAKLNAVAVAVTAACDPIDGLADGIIQDPRACLVDANTFVCGQPGAVPLGVNCLTPQEASALNKTWDGPPGPQPDQRLWFGWERGTNLDLYDASPPVPILPNYLQYWVYQDPAFDPYTLTEHSFKKAFLASELKFRKVVGTDNPDLSAFKAHGGKMIIYHGLADEEIVPRGSYNYYNNVTKAMGGLAATQKFYRFFPYPGNSHCGLNILPTFQPNAPQINTNDLFNALVQWVEHNTPPSQIIATQNPVTTSPGTRPICMYPNTLQYNGGNMFDASNFTCVTQTTDELQTAEKALADPGPIGP